MYLKKIIQRNIKSVLKKVLDAWWPGVREEKSYNVSGGHRVTVLQFPGLLDKHSKDTIRMHLSGFLRKLLLRWGTVPGRCLKECRGDEGQGWTDVHEKKLAEDSLRFWALDDSVTCRGERMGVSRYWRSSCDFEIITISLYFLLIRWVIIDWLSYLKPFASGE